MVLPLAFLLPLAGAAAGAGVGALTNKDNRGKGALIGGLTGGALGLGGAGMAGAGPLAGMMGKGAGFGSAVSAANGAGGNLWDNDYWNLGKALGQEFLPSRQQQSAQVFNLPQGGRLSFPQDNGVIVDNWGPPLQRFGGY